MSKRLDLHDLKARIVIDFKDFEKAWLFEKALKAIGVNHVRMEMNGDVCAPCGSNNHGMHKLAADRGVPCECPQCNKQEVSSDE